MAVEIERKFLVVGTDYRNLGTALLCKQGYISSGPDCTFRIRVIDNRGFITIKGLTKGLSRPEFEYEIPLEDANIMLNEFCGKPFIEKKRYTVKVNNLVWDVDEFEGLNNGLIIAEVHLGSSEQKITKPSWVGTEVSGDPRYFNVNLARNPFCKW
ncbi:MAG: CYTH domain-containing protein [Phycisphaerae bacterium]